MNSSQIIIHYLQITKHQLYNNPLTVLPKI